jgi:tetratricopeptide (TPR) repeat protein
VRTPGWLPPAIRKRKTPIRAEFLNRRNEFKRSSALFQEAIKKDPQFAPAYAGFPYGYVLFDLAPTREEAVAKWRANVKRALELDPNLDDAHRAYANMLGFAEWNWREALKEYQIAIRLNPNLAVAHQNYGMILAFMGRAEEGVRELKRAQRLDPASSGVGICSGWRYGTRAAPTNCSTGQKSGSS